MAEGLRFSAHSPHSSLMASSRRIVDARGRCLHHHSARKKGAGTHLRMFSSRTREGLESRGSGAIAARG